MAVTTTPGTLVDKTTAQQLRGRSVDVTGAVFRLLLMLALFLTIAVLVVLLNDVISQAWSVLTDGFGDFLSAGRSSSEIGRAHV